eukprot:1817779-Pyramimonas_sp.AAC.1
MTGGGHLGQGHDASLDLMATSFSFTALPGAPPLVLAPPAAGGRRGGPSRRGGHASHLKV